jgi:hypothetical protein
MVFRSAVTTTIQLDTPDSLRGRVISLLTLDFSLWSIGALAVGAVSDRLALWHELAIHKGYFPGHLSRESIAFGLSGTLGLMGAACLLSTVALARPIFRDSSLALDEREPDAPEPRP